MLIPHTVVIIEWIWDGWQQWWTRQLCLTLLSNKQALIYAAARGHCWINSALTRGCIAANVYSGT